MNLTQILNSIRWIMTNKTQIAEIVREGVAAILDPTISEIIIDLGKLAPVDTTPTV